MHDALVAHISCSAATCMMKCQAITLAGMYNVSHSIQKRFYLIEHNHIIWPRQVAKMNNLSCDVTALILGTDGRAPPEFLRNVPCETQILLDLFH